LKGPTSLKILGRSDVLSATQVRQISDPNLPTFCPREYIGQLSRRRTALETREPRHTIAIGCDDGKLSRGVDFSHMLELMCQMILVIMDDADCINP
jgi:hypothetical protein